MDRYGRQEGGRTQRPRRDASRREDADYGRRHHDGEAVEPGKVSFAHQPLGVAVPVEDLCENW